MSDDACVRLCALAIYGTLAASYVIAAVVLGPATGIAALTALIFAKIVLCVGTAYALVGYLATRSCGMDAWMSASILTVPGLFVVPITAMAILNSAEGLAITYGAALMVSFTGLSFLLAIGLVVGGIGYSLHHICQRA